MLKLVQWFKKNTNYKKHTDAKGKRRLRWVLSGSKVETIRKRIKGEKKIIENEKEMERDALSSLEEKLERHHITLGLKKKGDKTEFDEAAKLYTPIFDKVIGIYGSKTVDLKKAFGNSWLDFIAEVAELLADGLQVEDIGSAVGMFDDKTEEFSKFIREYADSTRRSSSYIIGLLKSEDWNLENSRFQLDRPAAKKQKIQEYEITLFEHEDISRYLRLATGWNNQIETPLPLTVTATISTRDDRGLDELLVNPRIVEKIIMAADYGRFMVSLMNGFEELAKLSGSAKLPFTDSEFAKEVNLMIDQQVEEAIDRAKNEADKQLTLDMMIAENRSSRRWATACIAGKAALGGIGTVGAFASTAVTGPFGPAGGYVALHCTLKTIVSGINELRILYGGFETNISKAEKNFDILLQWHKSGKLDEKKMEQRFYESFFSDLANPTKYAVTHLNQANAKLLGIEKKANVLCEDIETFLRLSNILEKQVYDSIQYLDKMYEKNATAQTDKDAKDKAESMARAVKNLTEEVKRQTVDEALTPMYLKIDFVLSKCNEYSVYVRKCEARIEKVEGIRRIPEIKNDSKSFQAFCTFMDGLDFLEGTVGSALAVGGGDILSGANPANPSGLVTAANVVGQVDIFLDTLDLGNKIIKLAKKTEGQLQEL